MDVSITAKPSGHKLIALLLALLFCTYLRVSLLLIYPFVAISLFWIFGWKLKKNALFFFGLLALSWIFSFRHGLFLKYNVVSFYYFIPFFLLLFASPQVKHNETDYLKILIRALSIIALISNILGFAQYIAHPYDDSFVGFYGGFTVSQNGLSLLNGILFFYYLISYQHNRLKKHLFVSLFFLVSCIMGFYGAGQLVLIAAVALTYFRVRLKYILQLLLISVLTIAIAVVLMDIVSPLTLDYNLAILKKFLNPSSADAPRKIIIFKNYLQSYPGNPLDFLFGSGPGTFNSRSAFMVGSPSYFNFELIKSDEQPYYFQRYAYPLWNASNTGPYDGFMNQPFSSLLAMLGEYGALSTTFLVIIFAKQFRYFAKLGNQQMNKRSSIAAKMFKFCCLFAAMLLTIDNYVEYPEIIALILIVMKLSQQDLKREAA